MQRSRLLLSAAALFPLVLAACDRSSPKAVTGQRAASALPLPRPAPDALPGVVDPWRWPRATEASDGERAIEDIGPYEPADRGQPSSPLVNTNAHYWTELVGIAWDRDVDLDFDNEPVDLDGDGIADAHLTRHLHARGGILAHPELFGLTPTPDDPRGRAGRISASTGVLGLREALRSDGTPSGQIGMTCWICHGGRNPADDSLTLGLAARDFDYGLVLATSALLDETDPSAVAYRRENGFASGRAVKARLLMAGPGRQDLVNEFGFDLTVPGIHSAFYPQILHARGKPNGVFNPVSVPSVLATPGLMLQNWVGSEDSTAPSLERLVALAQKPTYDALAAFGLPRADPAEARRALLTDLRNLATLSLQQDSYPGLLWSDAVYGGPTLRPEILSAIPPMYAAEAVRAALSRSAAGLVRPATNPGRVARGRAIFCDRIVGEVTNVQILSRAPDAYASAKLRGPVLAPIDPSRPLAAKLGVRCADCHNASPLDRVVSFESNPPPLGRCTHCHLAHPPLGRQPESDSDQGDERSLVSVATLPVPTHARGEVAYCEACHDEHRDFGPLVYSSSRLLPFDANLNGIAQGDEPADAAAGGIGTDSRIQIEVSPARRATSIHVPVIRDLRRPGPVDLVKIGLMWVRVAPLTATYASAPYLHNGSVPTLHALLEPADHRPATFPLGTTGFVLDTRLPGNRNTGHEYGVHLSASEKEDLIAFLQSL